MCGILSIFCHNTPHDTSLINQCSETLHGRGPDYKISLCHREALFFFHRLCIVDPTMYGNQPFVSRDVAVMCNGEIYNHLELERKYEVKCESKSDCEIILRLYEKWQDFSRVVKALDGVFAIVLVDGDKCYFARDRIGVRPLFLGKTKEGDVAVASLAKTLLPFCNDVQPVTPGDIFYFDRGNIEFPVRIIQTLHCKCNYDSYCTCGWSPDLQPSRYETACSKLHDLLVDAVRKRLMSDRPIGCLLSGGLDSSLVVAILCELVGSENVRTYSVGMEGGMDLSYAKKVAATLGTHHTEVIVTPEEALNAITEVIYDTETYDVTTIRASIMMWLLCKWISENTEDIVIYSGEGSDELFCGYLYFHNAPSPNHASEESKNLLKNLYLYDVLRADRSVSCHGLELRVPFLDTKIVDFSLALPPVFKAPMDGWEKKILRDAFTGYIPEEVLWRRKDGMSDAVSCLSKSWRQYIAEFVDMQIKDESFNSEKYMSKEAMYYKLIFNKFFPSYDLNIPMWMPKWSGNLKDPSGRLIEAFDEGKET